MSNDVSEVAMRPMFTFNINSNVRVKLTDHGRAVNKASWDALFVDAAFKPEYSPPQEDGDGWSKWQLWSLMGRFGECMSPGATLCFETEILIEVPTTK